MTTSVGRGMQPEDLLRLKSIDEVQLSPDGRLVAFVVREIDASKDEYRSAIWVVPTDGSRKPTQFTRGPKIDRAPRWSPDGQTLAFLSDRAGGRPQLYTMPVGGGEPRQLTNLPAGAGDPVWSPQGDQLVFAAPVVTEAPPRDRDGFERWRHRPKVIDRIPYKFDGVGFLLQAHMQLFVVPGVGGEVRPLTTDGRTHWHPAWSPDGRRITFAASRPNPSESQLFDIWTMDADGQNARVVTTDIDYVQWPAWSPDGQTIAFYGLRPMGDPMSWVWVVGAEGGTPRALTEEFDREVPLLPGFAIPPPVWSADGTTLTFSIADCGEVHLVRCRVSDGHVAEVVGGARWILVPSVNRAGQIAYVVSSPAFPGDVHVCAADGSDERRLTHLNEDLVAELILPRVERRSFANPNGGVVEGIVIRPATDRRTPLLVDIHGGPQGFVGSAFPVWHAFRYALVASGWTILLLNPSGSGSYGRACAHSLQGRWGEYDFPEQMAAIDALIRDGSVDADRLAVTGYSYGGFMTAWMVTHTDRFKAAVIGAPITNHESDLGTSDLGAILRQWNFGEQYRDREVYRRLSSVHLVDRVTTPTLLLHGEADDRCPLGQSEEFFAELVMAGKAPAQLVTYPGGSHGFMAFGRPSHRVDFNRRIIDWVERWTLAGAS